MILLTTPTNLRSLKPTCEPQAKPQRKMQPRGPVALRLSLPCTTCQSTFGSAPHTDVITVSQQDGLGVRFYFVLVRHYSPARRALRCILSGRITTTLVSDTRAQLRRQTSTFYSEAFTLKTGPQNALRLHRIFFIKSSK